MIKLKIPDNTNVFRALKGGRAGKGVKRGKKALFEAKRRGNPLIYLVVELAIIYLASAVPSGRLVGRRPAKNLVPSGTFRM